MQAILFTILQICPGCDQFPLRARIENSGTVQLDNITKMLFHPTSLVFVVIYDVECVLENFGKSVSVIFETVKMYSYPLFHEN